MKRPNNNIDNEPSESDASKRLRQQQLEAFNEDFAEIEATLRAQRANSDSTNIEMNHDPRMNNDRIVNNGNRASNSNGIISHEQKDGESMNVVEDDVGDDRIWLSVPTKGQARITPRVGKDFQAVLPPKDN